MSYCYVSNVYDIKIVFWSMNIRTIFYWNYSPVGPIQTVPACPIQSRVHHHIAVYMDSNDHNSGRSTDMSYMASTAALSTEEQIKLAEQRCEELKQ